MEDLQAAIEKVVLQEKTENKMYVNYADDVEKLVDSFKDELKDTFSELNPRWLGLRILDGDESLFNSL